MENIIKKSTIFRVLSQENGNYVVKNLESRSDEEFTLSIQDRVLINLQNKNSMATKSDKATIIMLKNCVITDESEIISEFKESYINIFSKENKNTLSYMSQMIEKFSINKFFILVERDDVIEEACEKLSDSQNLTIDLCNFIIEKYNKTWKI